MRIYVEYPLLLDTRLSSYFPVWDRLSEDLCVSGLKIFIERHWISSALQNLLLLLLVHFEMVLSLWHCRKIIGLCTVHKLELNYEIHIFKLSLKETSKNFRSLPQHERNCSPIESTMMVYISSHVD